MRVTTALLAYFNKFTHRRTLPGRKRESFRLYLLLQVLVFVLLTMGFFSWILRPNFKTIQNLSQEIQTTNQTILQTRQDIAGFKKTLSLPQADLNFKVYEATSEDTYLDLLVQPLDALNLELVNVALKEESPSANLLLQTGLLLDIRGDYKTLGEYLFALKSSPVLNRISSLSLMSDPESQQLTMHLNLEVYLTH